MIQTRKESLLPIMMAIIIIYGYCVVGEVDPANNTITFGYPNNVSTSNFVIVHSIGYDTTIRQSRCQFSQNVNAGSAIGQAKVGVVSGNSISFPSSPKLSTQIITEDINGDFYDPDEGNFLIVFKDNGNNGRPITGIVGTISGTTMSWGGL